MLRTVRVRVFSVLTAGVWPCVSWKEKGFGVSDASQVPEQLGSGSKKLTPKNVLLGLQHVLVSNVWLIRCLWLVPLACRWRCRQIW